MIKIITLHKMLSSPLNFAFSLLRECRFPFLLPFSLQPLILRVSDKALKYYHE